MNIFYIGLIGLLTGVIGTLGGGIIALIFRKINESLLGFILGISGGIMTAIVFIDLIPESLQEGSLWSMLFGLILGVLMIMGLDLSFPHQHISVTENTQGRFIKAGLLLTIGIALHNLPEGLAIGSSYVSNISLGVSIAIVIALQNLPEGLAVATTLCLGEMKMSRVLILTALSGVPMGLGAFLGAYFGGISPIMLSVSLSLAAGAMLYITFDELVPDAHNLCKESHWATMGIVMGMVIGVLVTGLL